MKEKVLEIIADYKGVDASSIDTSKTWAELGFDSLDVTELAIRLEDDLGVEIDMSPEIVSVDALVAYIESIA